MRHLLFCLYCLFFFPVSYFTFKMSEQQQHILFVMPHPDTIQFDDGESAFGYLTQFAHRNGIAITKARTLKGRRGRLRSIDIKCDLGGHYVSRRTGPSVRNGTGTRLIGCPFFWVLKTHGGNWHLEMKNNNHTHLPDEDVSGHPSARRLNEQQLSIVRDMSITASAPRHIMSYLRQQDPTILSSSRTINNERHRLRQQALLDGHQYKLCFMNYMIRKNMYLTSRLAQTTTLLICFSPTEFSLIWFGVLARCWLWIVLTRRTSSVCLCFR